VVKGLPGGSAWHAVNFREPRGFVVSIAKDPDRSTTYPT
jgi:hypothetical protein